MRRRLVVLLAAAVVQLGGSLVLYCEGSPEVALNEMVVVSGGVSPRVAYGLSREKGALTVTVSVALFPNAGNGGRDRPPTWPRGRQGDDALRKGRPVENNRASRDL